MANVVIMSPQQMLSEMDKALEIEIEAKEKSGNSRPHIAVDGQPCGDLNGFYLYQYSLNEPWTPEDDTPVEVQIQSNLPVNATIVSSTGTVITIATREPLPPEALKQIILLDDSIKLTKRLREALQNNHEGDSKLGLKVFGHQQSYCGEAASSIPSTVFEPNESQRKAINTSLGSEVTYIIGPPGTGKTVTLAAIAFEHLTSERTVLIASHTNIAVDNAIKQLADLCRKAGMDNILREGKVLRYGATQLPELKKTEYEDISISAIAKRRSVHLYQQKEQLETSLHAFEEDLQKLTIENQQWQIDWKNKRQQAVAQISAYEEEMSRLQVIEEQRKTDLTNNKSAWEKSYKQSRQQLSTIEQQLVTANAEQVRLETAYQQYKQQQVTLTLQLAAAQQMSKVTRLFKGVRLDKLEKNVSDVNYQIWHIEERLKELRQNLNKAYEARAACESQLEQKTRYLQQIESQLHTPTNETERIASLQATISPWKRYLAEGDQRCEAAQTYFQQQEGELNKNIAERRSQLSELDRELQELEKRILAEAQVVATTLSKLYMSVALNDRRFDIVIVDEISAASIPAVYIGASRANSAVITIGDPQQLAPIYTAQSDNKLDVSKKQIAKTWLGTDLFSHLHITLESAFGGQRNCAMLTHQARMHPDISTLARNHVYKRRLLDEVRRVPKEEYAHIEPGKGQHLLLCDTSDADPIAVRPESGSRFNVYHALCTIAIARQVLLSLGNNTSQEGKERIGIVTPYNKQAKLLQRLIDDAGMKQRVRAGTVHKFQGLEFDVVIFDTVESPPNPPPEDFLVIGLDAIRLINVAITRAKHKLIIVANARHIETALGRNGGFAFPADSLLRKVVVEGRNSGNINSSDVLESLPDTPEEKQNRYQNSQKLQSLLGGNKQLNIECLYEERLNEVTFFSRFKQDIEAAKRRIVIVSPYVANRAKEFLPLLEKKCKQGVTISVVIDPDERFEKSSEIEDMLKQVGIEILSYPKAHMKHAIIDEEIIYDGSLNILSHKDRHESMIRKRSHESAKMVWEELSKTIKKEAREQALLSRKPEQKGADITIRAAELPVFSKCVCGYDMIPKMKKRPIPFYGCENFSNNQSHTSIISVEERHLSEIPRLKNARCRCNGPMRMKKDRDDVWLECATPVSCGHWQHITFIQ